MTRIARYVAAQISAWFEVWLFLWVPKSAPGFGLAHGLEPVRHLVPRSGASKRRAAKRGRKQ